MNWFKLILSSLTFLTAFTVHAGGNRLNIEPGAYTVLPWKYAPEAAIDITVDQADVIRVHDRFRNIDYHIDPKFKAGVVLPAKFSDEKVFSDNPSAAMSRRYVSQVKIINPKVSSDGKSMDINIEVTSQIPSKALSGVMTIVFDIEATIATKKDERWVNRGKLSEYGYRSAELINTSMITVSTNRVSVKSFTSPLGGVFDRTVHAATDVVLAIVQTIKSGDMTTSYELFKFD